MSIIQNEYRESEQCQASVGVSGQDTFDCLTVCVATHTTNLMDFYFARLGDSILSKSLVWIKPFGALWTSSLVKNTVLWVYKKLF